MKDQPNPGERLDRPHVADVLQEFVTLMDANSDWPDTSLVALGDIAKRARLALAYKQRTPLSAAPARREFLALAESCGAQITGKPDGSEPVSVVFTPKAWQEFDRAVAPVGRPTRQLLLECAGLPRDEIRELRLWHWRQALLYSKHVNDPSYSPDAKAACRYLHSIHIKAVQALNDMFPIGDTAEGDDNVQG